MPKVTVSDACFQRLMLNACGRMSRGFSRVANGWELEVSQPVLDRVLQHALPGESIGETVQRVVALGATI